MDVSRESTSRMWPHHTPRAHRDTQEQHGTTPGWAHGGGMVTPPATQTSPHNPLTLCLQARARDGRAEGGGTVT